jgi:anti-anti-sigma factor
MGIATSMSPDGTSLEIRVGERFDFSEHKEFRAAYADADLSRARVVVELGAAEYMDSAALGMLLVLRERAGGERADITLRGAREEIMAVLSVSRFEQLFRIE